MSQLADTRGSLRFAVVVCIQWRDWNNRHILTRFIEWLDGMVPQWGGTMLVSTGTWYMMGFNIPEEVPLPSFLAIQSSLEMVRMLYQLQTEEQSLILPGISIERGEILYHQDSQGHTVQGEMIEISQTMAQFAEEGIIVVTRGVHQDVQSTGGTFKVAGKSEIALKDYDEPLKVVRLTLPDQPSASTDTLSALVHDTEAAPQVIVAEDNPALRSAFAKVLKNAGFRIRTAANGYEVMQCLSQGIPGVMVMDVGLPGYSGLDLLGKIRALEGNQHINIIMVTGNHLAEQSPEAKLADLFLFKPVSTRDLVHLVQRFLNRDDSSTTQADSSK